MDKQQQRAEAAAAAAAAALYVHERVRAGVATFQALDRKEAAVWRTYHGPHAIRGGGADRVVVWVCCCIDSAVAAWKRKEGSLI